MKTSALNPPVALPEEPAMPEMHFRFRHARLPGLLLAVAACTPALAFDSGSTGADGALNPAVNVQIQLPASGVLNYTSINIPTGVTVTFKRNALNTPVYLLVSGNVTIAGAINVSGGDGRNTDTTGDASVADDGIPGVGGPGGFDGGRGGALDAAQRASVIEGGAGYGPGGAQGGRVVNRTYGNCNDNRYTAYVQWGLGAAFASNGPDAYYVQFGCNGGSPAATAYGNVGLQPLIGGSGGGGGRGTATIAGAGGGGGGGALLIAASGTVQVTGQVVADAGNAGLQNSGSPGGGGSGGAIRLMASTFSGNGQLYARRGCGRNSSGQYCVALVDAGSAGRIRVEADVISFNGTSDPLFSAATPSAITLTNVPALRIATVAGVSVPAQPTGLADLSFPSTVTNPVTVVFSTINLPLGSTINLRVLPAIGLPVDAVSTPVTGDLSAGSASASIALPQGPSRMEARASFPVTASQADRLLKRAGNEAVKSIEFVATLGEREPKAVLVTVTGKRFEVPLAVLIAEGLWS